MLAGDIVALYAALFFTLLIRYGSADYYAEFRINHALPFSIIFFFWIVVFYISGLYDLRHLRNNIDFLKTLALAIIVNSGIAIVFFYLVPLFGIAPKTNLFIFIIVFTAIEAYWRRSYNRILTSGEAPYRVLVMGNGQTTQNVIDAIRHNPQLGYEIQHWIESEPTGAALKSLRQLIGEQNVNLIIIPQHFKKDSELATALYELLSMGIEIRDLPSFYELVFRKVPLSDLEESWFLENLAERRRFYDPLKRASEFVFALVLGIVLLPIEILIAILIKFTSPGPVIYRQLRTGENGKPFMLYKFRTMRSDAEKDGAKWADPNDIRATSLGKILRYTHLDELPQLVNVIKNELSFVGPRPERPEFIKVLAEKIPYYEIRHLVKPGVTGWAQISYRYGASVEDSYEKLQYDIYYLKNRSLILDFAIVIRTLKSFFVNQK